MFSTNSPDSPLGTSSLSPGDVTVPKRRGRPLGSRNRPRVVSDTVMMKSRASQRTPDQKRIRSVYSASPPTSSVLFSSPQYGESPSTSLFSGLADKRPTEDPTTPAQSPFSEDHDVDTSGNESHSHLLRSSASAPEVPQALQSQRRKAAAAERPNELRKSKSAPPERSQSLSASQLDSKIVTLLRTPLSKTEVERKNVGNNYVFEVVTSSGTGERVVKVGYTKGPEQERLDKIASVCQHVQIDHSEDPEHIPIRLYDRAEKLAQRELAGFTHKFDCECGQNHREYFAVEPEAARDAVRRWREFCRQEPYDSEGQLQPFWKHRLDSMSVQQCRRSDSETIDDHDKRAERWRAFISATDFEKVQFGAGQLGSRFWKFRWRGIAILQSLAIVILTFPSEKAVVCMVGIFCCVIIELLDLEFRLVWEVIRNQIEKVQKVLTD